MKNLLKNLFENKTVTPSVRQQILTETTGTLSTLAFLKAFNSKEAKVFLEMTRQILIDEGYPEQEVNDVIDTIYGYKSAIEQLREHINEKDGVTFSKTDVQANEG